MDYIPLTVLRTDPEESGMAVHTLDVKPMFRDGLKELTTVHAYGLGTMRWSVAKLKADTLMRWAGSEWFLFRLVETLAERLDRKSAIEPYRERFELFKTTTNRPPKWLFNPSVYHKHVVNLAQWHDVSRVCRAWDLMGNRVPDYTSRLTSNYPSGAAVALHRLGCTERFGPAMFRWSWVRGLINEHPCLANDNEGLQPSSTSFHRGNAYYMLSSEYYDPGLYRIPLNRQKTLTRRALKQLILSRRADGESQQDRPMVNDEILYDESASLLTYEQIRDRGLALRRLMTPTEELTHSRNWT